jgi:hypothetical protein
MTRTLCWGKVQGRFPDGNKFTLPLPVLLLDSFPGRFYDTSLCSNFSPQYVC